ncbi:MAG: NADH-quinone oxidoreductase subunit N [Gemmatimonadetes bacterium]|nr:NADH-quinone oxidoreductase subunit N [Gemmatimonadota bacterium]
MPLDLTTPGGITLALTPELVLTVWVLVLMLVAAWRHRDAGVQREVGLLTVIGLVSTGLAVAWLWAQGATPVGLPAMMALDGFRFATSLVFLLGALLTVMLSLGYVDRERIQAPEYYVLILLGTLGMMFMAGAADLVVMFLGLELMSVAVYVLAGVNRRSVFAAEAALKYFLLGAFASGFFLYGIALVYGATGTTNLWLIHGRVTAFMAAAVKAAGFAALVRVLHQAFDGLPIWHGAVWWLAVITMVVGNVIALAQRPLKRMLAYSSIAHAGYLLVAVASGSAIGSAAFLFYAVVYTLMTIGAFAVLAAAGTGGEQGVLIDDLNGLATRRPWIAAAMTVFMLSLLGFPGTAGFIGKWYILSAAVDADQRLLAVILVGASVVSAGFYLPPIMAMYMRPAPSAEAHQATRIVGAARWAVGVMAVALLLFGFWPNRARSQQAR